MALIDKLFGKKEKSLTELTTQELRREEILLTKDRDKLFKKIEQTTAEKQKIFDQGAAQKSPELRKALAMQFDLKHQEQMLVGRQLNLRSKELLTVSRVRMAKENAPKLKGTVGRLKLSEKDIARITTWISDDSINQDVYNERLDEVLGMGADADREAMEHAGLSGTGNEVINLWQDMDKGQVSPEDAFNAADKAMRGKNDSMEKNV